MLTKASHKNDAGNTSKQVNKIQSWDFAIAWRPGWHITVFPLLWWILVCVAMLVVAAIVAAIWFFETT